MKKYKPYLGRVDLVKNQVEREKLAEQEASDKRKRSIQQQNKQRWLKYQEQLRSELAARYFHAVQSTGGESFSNKFSVAFDGVDDRTETSVNYSEFDGETKGTFSFWFKCNGNNSNQHDTVVKVGPPYSRRTFEIELRMASQVQFIFKIGTGVSGYNVFVNIGNFRQDDSWHHILFCVDLSLSPNENKTKLFVDGDEVTLSGGINNSSFPSHPATLTVGGTTQSNLSFQGNLDEVALWGGIDLRDAVDTIYSSGNPNDLNSNGLTVPTTYYRMGDNDGGTGTTVTDNGTTNYDLSFVSDPTFEEDVPTN